MIATNTNLVRTSPSLPRPYSRAGWSGWLIFAYFSFILLAGFLIALTGMNPGAFGVFVGLSVVLVAFYRRRTMQRMIQINQDASVLLAKNQVGKAQQLFLKLYQQSRFYPYFQALFLHNYGISELRLGDLDRAYEHCSNAFSSGWLHQNRVFTAAIYPQFCLGWTMLHTLRGDLQAARVWLDRAKQNTSEAYHAEMVSAEMLFWARSGDWGQVIHIFEQNYSEIKDVLALPGLRRLHLLRTFAEEQHKGSSYREIISDSIAYLRDASPSEFSFLTVSWPELHAFITQLGFSPPQLRPSDAGLDVTKQLIATKA